MVAVKVVTAVQSTYCRRAIIHLDDDVPTMIVRRGNSAQYGHPQNLSHTGAIATLL